MSKNPSFFRSPLLYLLILILVGGAGYLIMNQEKQKPPTLDEWLAQNPQPKIQPSSIGAEKDDPMSRVEYDWYRLHDPSSGQIPPAMRTRELAFAKNLPVRGQQRKAGEKFIATQNWDSRGPVNVGGRTRALAVDVAQSNRVLAGGVTGGMWISEDGGDTWQMTTDIAEIPGVTSVAQDRREGHTDTWYYSTGEYTGSGSRDINSRYPMYTGDGIFKSTDGGLSWSQLESTSSLVNQFDNPFDVIFRVRTNPANLEQEEVWVAAYGTIQRSLDGGESWEQMLGWPSDVSSAWTDVAVTDDGVVWATLDSETFSPGIYRMNPGDAMFTNVTPEGFAETYNRCVIGYYPADQELLYFICHTPGSGWNNEYMLWRYDNREDQDEWTDLSEFLPDFTSSSLLGFGATYAAQGGYNMTVAIHPIMPNVVYIGGTSLFRSLDGFTSHDDQDWIGGYNYYFDRLPGEEGTNVSYPKHHADVHNIVFDPSNSNILYTSHDGGISKSVDPLFSPDLETPFPWEYIDGYPTTQFYCVAVDPLTPGDRKILGGMQDNGTWISGGGTFDIPWISMLGGDGMACEAGIAENPDHRSWYCTTQYGGNFIRIVLDENDEFYDYYWFGPSTGNFSRWITPFHLAPYDSRVMLMMEDSGVLLNPDVVGGEEYIEVSGSHINDWWTPSGDISTNVGDGPVVYFGAYDMSETQPSRVYRIDDPFGTTPVVTDVSDPLLFPVGGWPHDIAIDPRDPDVAMVVFTNYNRRSLLLTTDGGENWRDVGGNLEENPDGTGSGPGCFWAELTYVNDQPFALVGTTVGLFSTTDLSADPVVWEQEGADVLGNVWVTTMDVRQEDGFVAIGTHGRGTYSAFITLSGVNQEPSSELPAEYTLEPAYPNPFNASTSVTVSLPVRSELTVEVFDIQGRRIQKLANGSFTAGSHRFTLNGRRLSSGVYFVRATVPGHLNESQRIVLVK